MLEWQSVLAEAVRSALRTAFDAAPETVTFQYPPRVEMGDLALTTPFDLAKTLRRKPREIAEKLAAGLAAPGIRKAGAAAAATSACFSTAGASRRELKARARDP
jgi:arginyl-tRNA synthetase